MSTTSTLGPKLTELDQVCETAEQVKSTITVRFDNGGLVEAVAHMQNYNYSPGWRDVKITHMIYVPGEDKKNSRTWTKEGLAIYLRPEHQELPTMKVRFGDFKKISEAMMSLGDILRHGDLQFDEIVVQSKKSPVSGKALKQLFREAWLEVFERSL